MHAYSFFSQEIRETHPNSTDRLQTEFYHVHGSYVCIHPSWVNTARAPWSATWTWSFLLLRLAKGLFRKPPLTFPGPVMIGLDFKIFKKKIFFCFVRRTYTILYGN